MVVVIVGVDTYHWWGPLGYLFRNTPGNLVASALWAGPAFLLGYVKGWRKHLKPHLQRTREIHEHLGLS